MQILFNILIAYGVFCMIFVTVFLWNLVKNIRKEVDLYEKDIGSPKEYLQVVYIEQAGDMYRMYDKITNQFICQAKDELELWDIAKERFPTKKIVTLNEDAEVRKL